jgi:hypothetical protein
MSRLVGCEAKRGASQKDQDSYMRSERKLVIKNGLD